MQFVGEEIIQMKNQREREEDAAEEALLDIAEDIGRNCTYTADDYRVTASFAWPQGTWARMVAHVMAATGWATEDAVDFIGEWEYEAREAAARAASN